MKKPSFLQSPAWHDLWQTVADVEVQRIVSRLSTLHPMEIDLVQYHALMLVKMCNEIMSIHLQEAYGLPDTFTLTEPEGH